MPKLKKIATGIVATAVVIGGTILATPSTPEEITLQEQITELELLIEERTENGQSTTMQVQKKAALEQQLKDLK